ncbi:amino acid adenylation domain-containing protein [Flavobacterium tructae]|uniref:non-ribosomal peptide synthetase n=1 Tax=Flavobacterium tructae TaxID=1114873 RepID=UPI002551D5B3|nr:non-ribosomal peptide synthetase [Flavobacterium tructae]MDL2144169.1 amino acid adenylation domain-containing protein [Flavobacterium tructae]
MTTIEQKSISNYWVTKVKNNPVINSIKAENGNSKKIQVDTNNLSFFKKLTSENAIAELTVLITVYTALLQRYFEVESFIFMSKPTDAETALLFKSISASGQSFKDYLGEVKKELQEVYKHSDYDDTLQEKYPFVEYAVFGFFYNSKSAHTKNNFPFSLSVNKSDTELELSLSYDVSFVEDHVAAHFLSIYANWLLQLEHFMNDSVDQIPVVTPLEKEELLNSFNPSVKKYPTKTLVELFEEQVAKTPTHTAVIFKDRELTYNELNQHANQLAHYLRQEYDIQPNDLVGIKLERNEFIAVVVLGILKSGAAYVPVDVNYPEERIKYIEEDSQCKVVIDENEFRNFLNQKDNYKTDNPERLNQSTDLAYIIYTSGTTGNPKGVMITHHNAVVLLYWSQEEFNAAAFDVAYAATSYCFDLSVYELFYPLSIGKKIRILDNALEIGEALQYDKKVLINTVPSSIRNTIESGYSLENAAIINLAGEPFPVDIAKKLLQTNAEIRNLYGPSEDTTYSTVYRLSPQKEYTASVSIGKPLANTQVYLLDKNLELVPVGVAGKLYISGDGLSKGYLNRPELTAEKFIPNPFKEKSLMYDTGDMAKWLPDGTIDFLGRKDYQVKLRGYRIELGEIENAVLSFSENITQAVALVLSKNEVQNLVVYFTKTKVTDHEILKNYLKEKLPAFMIPHYLIGVDKIPLTPNGKIDRKVLENLPLNQVSNANYVAPKSETEKALTIIWQEILGIEKVGIEDNFFDLGGHSLMIGQVINLIYKQLEGSISYKEFFLTPTIAQISQKIQKGGYKVIPKAKAQEYYPLTSSQHKIWVLSQFEGGNSAYNMHGALKFRGDLEVSKLEKAFRLLIAKYEILRTYFKAGYDGEISQYILEEGEWNFTLTHENYLNKSTEEISQYLKEQQAAIFDLTKAPLLKAALLKTEENEHILSLVVQHTISDGWSLELMFAEVVAAYNNLIQEKPVDFSPAEIQFKDYAIWLQSQENEEAVLDSENYWLSVFKEDIPVLELPSYRSRPVRQTYNGNTLSYQFSEAFLSKLKHFSKTNNVTPFMTLMAGINALLYRYTNQNTIVLGTPIAGREHPDLENQLGLFLNTLAIKTEINGTNSFSTLLELQRKILIEAYEHQNYSFSTLVNKLNLKRDASRSALFDVLVILQNQAQLNTLSTNVPMLGVEIEPYEVKRNTAQFDLSFIFTEQEERLLLSLEYNTDLYDAFWIKAIFKHFENLLTTVFTDANVTIDTIEYLEETEKELLLKTFNATEIYFPKEATIVDLLESQAAKTPNDCALIFNDVQLTYKELHEQSNQLGDYLRENYAIRPNDLVGVRLKRDERLLLTILGVLKSGAAYVPMDVNYPEDRIKYIVEDSNCKVVIDENEWSKFQVKKQHYSIENLPKINRAEDLAYVIYTSGTTGKPKGVLITNKNVTALLYWAKKEFNTERFDLVYAVTSHCFDLSAYEMFFTLSVGKTIKLLSNALEISKELKADKKVLLNTVPSSIRSLMEEDFSSLENASIINLAGEPFPVDIARELLRTTAEIRNLYGPSEDTTYSTYYQLEKGKAYKTIPVGKPISNTQAYVLDKNLQLTPLGIVGKLYLAGEGVALGYLNKEELTAAKFIKNPFVEGSVLYDTGDMVKWFPDGNIEFLGRKDHQVKLRGYRIELDEIENGLLQFSEDLKQVVVAVKPFKGADTLVAYYTTVNAISKDDLKAYLQSKLPAYMVPQYYVEVPFIPLSPNGKTDKEALPNIDETNETNSGYVEPKGRIEKIVALIWKDILAVETISAADDFFNLGGHSLKLGQLINKINEQLQVTVPFEKLFEYSVLRDQAELIKRSFSNNFEPITAVPAAASYEMSYAQKSLWMVSQFKGNEVAYNIPAVYHFHGTLDIIAFKEAFYRVIKKHEILRTVFKEDDEKSIRQFITPSEEFKLSIGCEDFSDFNDKELLLQQEIKQISNFEFDLFKGPLFKAKLIRIDSQHHVLLFVIHHIISDAWSLQLLIEEISSNYNSILKKEAVLPSSKLDIQYKEYSQWLKTQIETNAITSAYWMKELQGHLKPLQYKYEYLLPDDIEDQDNNIDFFLNAEVSSAIKKIAKKLNVTEFSFHLAAFFSFLHLQTEQSDIVLGVPFAGRAHAHLEDQLGYYVNLLPIRVKLHQNENFETIIRGVQHKLSKAFEHQMYPIDLILRDLEFERGDRGSNFINTGFTWNELTHDEFTINENLKAKAQSVATEQVKYDLWVISNGSNFTLEYRKEVFSKDTIALFTERYLVFLEELSKGIEHEIGAYSFKTEREKQLEASRINIEINF